MQKSIIAALIVVLQIVLQTSTMARQQNESNLKHAYSKAELAQILAPIALYPDNLLSHIVVASTYPLEVIEAHRWLQKHRNLASKRAVDLASRKTWDPSVVALIAFPNVLERLHNDIRWTQDLGNAFLIDERSVLNTIQVLRLQAKKAHSFEHLQNMNVSQVNTYIIIEPRHKNVIYVPYYDTRLVYGNWQFPHHPPIYWHRTAHRPLHLASRISTGFHWDSGIQIGFNFFFSAFNWHKHQVVVNHHSKVNPFRSYKRFKKSKQVKPWQHKRGHKMRVSHKPKKWERS